MSQSQKEAAEYAEVLMAYSRGEAVQMRLFSADPWLELSYPLWDFGRYEYRVAPKPREEWRWLFSNGATSSAYETKETLLSVLGAQQGRPILMREVTE